MVVLELVFWEVLQAAAHISAVKVTLKITQETQR